MTKREDITKIASISLPYFLKEAINGTNQSSSTF